MPRVCPAGPKSWTHQIQSSDHFGMDKAAPSKAVAPSTLLHSPDTCRNRPSHMNQKKHFSLARARVCAKHSRNLTFLRLRHHWIMVNSLPITIGARHCVFLPLPESHRPPSKPPAPNALDDTVTYILPKHSILVGQDRYSCKLP